MDIAETIVPARGWRGARTLIMNERDWPRHLIMGLAYGYKEADLAPFLLSFLEHASSSRLHLFVDDNGAAIVAGLGERRVTCTDIAGFQTTCLTLGLRPEIARYFLYRDFLREASADFDEVMITDVRDVFFQNDPFDGSGSRDGIRCALEDERIGKCPINTAWIETLYGPEVAESLGGYPISCSGTTSGEAQAMSRYLDGMCAEIKSKPLALLESKFGLDQGFHNVMVRRGDAASATFPENHVGFSTLHFTHPDRLSWGDGTVIVDGHLKAPIVHQYDRHSSMKDHVADKYPLEALTSRKYKLRKFASRLRKT